MNEDWQEALDTDHREQLELTVTIPVDASHDEVIQAVFDALFLLWQETAE